MKKSEVLKLLTIASAFDNRRPTDVQVEAWHAVIGDLDYALAEAAVRRHFRESSQWMLPVHVVDGAAALATEQAWTAPTLSPDEAELCAAAGVPPEEFAERRAEAGFSDWVAHLRSKWQGITR